MKAAQKYPAWPKVVGPGISHSKGKFSGFQFVRLFDQGGNSMDEADKNFSSRVTNQEFTVSNGEGKR